MVYYHSLYGQLKHNYNHFVVPYIAGFYNKTFILVNDLAISLKLDPLLFLSRD